MLETPITKKTIDNLNKLSALTGRMSDYEWEIARLERNLKELDELEPKSGKPFTFERSRYQQELAQAKTGFTEVIDELNQILQNSILTINKKEGESK